MWIAATCLLQIAGGTSNIAVEMRRTYLPAFAFPLLVRPVRWVSAGRHAQGSSRLLIRA
jgi:hypothetical protein